ncbi:MAG: NAD-dependent epimerase/dehydratase family protein [Legionellales bacterium]
MIIGSGMLAKLFSTYENNDNIIIFASGVSNSQETQAAAFKREHYLLVNTLQENPEKTLVYFSTGSVYDSSAKDSLYVIHKKHMEQLIQKHAKKYYIFRLSHVVGKTSSPTIINFLKQKINSGETFELWANSTRNLIAGEDVFKLVDYILNHDLFKNEIINIASHENLSIQKIVYIIEGVLGKSAHFTLTQKGAAYPIDISLIEKILPKAGVSFKKDYVSIILKNALMN